MGQSNCKAPLSYIEIQNGQPGEEQREWGTLPRYQEVTPAHLLAHAGFQKGPVIASRNTQPQEDQVQDNIVDQFAPQGSLLDEPLFDKTYTQGLLDIGAGTDLSTISNCSRPRQSSFSNGSHFKDNLTHPLEHSSFEDFERIAHESLMIGDLPQMKTEDELDIKWTVECSTPTTDKNLPTTLMIRNIPQKYTQEELVLDWPDNGTYDFFYLPTCSTLKTNKTYCFINFITMAAALDFKAKWNKKRLSRFRAQRTLNVSWAVVQGQMRKGQHCRFQNQESQPIIFHKGQQLSFEEATLIMAALKL